MDSKKQSLIEEFTQSNTKQKEQIFLEWKNINYFITVENKSKPKTKTENFVSNEENLGITDSVEDSIIDPNKKIILKNIDGFANPNELLVIMGPSGSGKTSLLNIIANRQLPSNSSHEITREVLLNYSIYR